MTICGWEPIMDDGVDSFYLQSPTTMWMISGFKMLVPVRNLICQIARKLETCFSLVGYGLGNDICMQNYYTWGLNMPGHMGQIEILVHHLIRMMLKQNDMINGFDYLMLKLYCEVYEISLFIHGSRQ